MSSPASTSITETLRERIRSKDLSESAEELIAFLEAAESEAPIALLVGGGLLSFQRDYGLDEHIRDIVAKVRPDNEANEAAINQLGDEGLQSQIWESRWHHNRAAYCLGLAIGRQLGTR